jgi:glucose/arabinose dehydrogenase
MRISVRVGVAALAAALLWTADPNAAVPPQVLRLVPYASGFASPVGIVQDPTDSRVQFVIEQGGRIRTVVDGVIQPTDFLNVSSSIVAGGEQGLLGLAFPPDAATSRRFYVNFTANSPSGATVVARFTRSANPRIADPASRFDLQWSRDPQFGDVRYIPQPFANHNGGCLQFGPDGYLYIGMGDGGSGNDPDNNGQKASSLLGKMLRIDVAGNDPKGFVVPPDNPFKNAAGFRPEIWDVGLRNPWRFSFDDAALGGSGALIIGDVGQNRFEEVDYEPRGRGGRNYGWRIKEGLHDNVAGAALFTPLSNPMHEYDHATGQSITGGYMYRGSQIPEMRGRYVFADFSTGRIWSFAVATDASGEGTRVDLVEHTGSLQVPRFNISSFGVDSGGELFVVNYGGGVYRLMRGAPRPPTNLRIIR